MQNLRTAYVARDSVEYKALFHDDYRGTSLDQNDPTPQLLIYTKADEAQHISGLARSSVTSVQLDLVPGLVLYTDAGDPPGWRTIQKPFTRLIVDSLEVPMDRDYMEYKFIPKTPDPSSSTDTTWKIIGWTEVLSPPIN